MSKCDEIFDNIVFDIDKISSCSCVTNKYGAFVNVEKNYNVQELMDLYFETVNKVYESLNDNKLNIYESCKGCYRLNISKPEKSENSTGICENRKIKYLHITNWRYCNLNCIYCVFKDQKKDSHTYNVYPFIKYLKEKNKLSDELQVMIHGGEPGILEGIEDILKLLFIDFEQLKQLKISLLTNFVEFKKIYEKLFRKGVLYINTSLDCSDKKLYKLIHQQDKFNQVIKNLKKAVKFSINDEQVKIKFIIIENVNDTQTEIINFLKLAKKLKIKKLQFDFDRSELNIGRKLPNNILELYAFAKKQSEANGFILDIDDRSEEIFYKKIYI